MKLQTFFIPLLLLTNFSIASDIKKEACPSGCGPIEHVFSKNIIKRYAEQNPSSGLPINIDNENVPTNIIDAAINFGLNTILTGIVPVKRKDGQGTFLPLYTSKDFQLRKSIVAMTAINDKSTSSGILAKWEKQYNLSKILMQKYAIKNISVTDDGIIICPPCSLKERK